MMASRPILLIGLMLAFNVCAHADFVEETLVVHNKVVSRMCESHEITVVNGSFPGPAIYVHEGDNVAIHVINNSPYNMTIHWHGVFQLLSNWQDGPAYVTQCPIRPGNNYTYRFNVTGQEGTLFWHAHTGWHRATVHGAFIIYPRKGSSYPFAKPDGEFPVVLGEWFNTSIVNLEEEELFIGNNPKNMPEGLTINGWLGDFYPCSLNRRFLPEDPQTASLQQFLKETGSRPDDIYKMKVKSGKSYLMRIVCATLNEHAFFKVANHNLTVVAVDAVYTIPYTTNVVALSPGQTVDVIIIANQHPAIYYMSSSFYHPINAIAKTAGATGPTEYTYKSTEPQTSLLIYEEVTISSSSTPILSDMPEPMDWEVAYRFFNSLKGLQSGPHWVPVPLLIDEKMFITAGFGLTECMHKNRTICQGINHNALAASLNNESFQLPATSSILHAYYHNISGIYTTDFPDNPPTKFDYSSMDNKLNLDLMWVNKGTKVKRLKYNSTVEIVLQDTAFLSPESHPIHFHGFNFYVLAQGSGNYDPLKDYNNFNLVNPYMRNTIALPMGGWVAIRFTANNPGVWYMHCHMEMHVPYGLGTAFIVEDGPTPSTKLPAPPSNFPSC